MKRRLAAVLVSDVVGYTKLMEEDTEGTVSAWSSARDIIIEPLIASRDGRIVKFTGDGFLAEFKTVREALECGIELQNSLKENILEFRMGINLGDIIDDGKDIHGEGINIAARLEEIAEAGGICISGDVYNQVRNRVDAEYEDLGEQQVKNVSEPVQTYAVRFENVKSVNDVIEAAVERPSIAILAFDNLSGDPEQEFFSDGITEDIITALSRIRQIFVIARNTTFSYKGQAIDVKAVAQELGVRYVLEGSVRKAGNKMRITAQLIDGTTGNHLWAEKYDREVEDIFEIQDEITQAVVGAIGSEINEAERERAKSKPPENLDAWELYQRGMAHIWDRYTHGNQEEIDAAKLKFQKAIEIDPNFSDAYAGLAEAYFYSLIMGYSEDQDRDISEGTTAARRAIALATNDAAAHVAMASIRSAGGETELAAQHSKTAININPNHAGAWNKLGSAQLWLGKSEESISALNMALKLSPRDPGTGPIYTRLAEAFFQLGDYETAVDWGRKAIERPETQFWGNCVLISALSHMGDSDAAEQALGELIQRKPEINISFVNQQYPGRKAKYMADYIEGLRKAGLPEN